MHPTIMEAINQRRVLNVFYEGYNRLVEPHVYGINSPGNEVVRSYQTDGGSKSGKVEGWKELWISKLDSVVITDRTFVPRASRSPWNEKPMRQVYAQV